MAHTPGPWTVDQPWAGFSAIRAGNRDIVFALSAPGPQFGDREYSPEEKEANARLIAAAPELLAALKVAVVQLYEEVGRRELAGLPEYLAPIAAAIRQAEQAIVKAGA